LNTDNSNHELPLGSIILRCREQTARYQSRTSYDPSSCYELWRRAIQEKDSTAWEAVYITYNPFVRNWLQKQTSKLPRGFFEDDALVNGVFFRMLRFVKPENFANFPTLAAVMKYLQMCCLTEVQDILRYNQGRSKDVSLEANVRGDDESSDGDTSQSSRLSSNEDVEKSASDRADRNPFWQIIVQRLPEKADQVLIYARFVLGMPPREIASTYPQYFNDVDEVYRRLKNAIWRLRNDEDLKKWLQDL
jgi:DNA-directed RNA polymerase specialized sigma subunit